MEYNVDNIHLNFESFIKEYFEGDLTCIKIYNADTIRGQFFQYLNNLEYAEISDSVKYIGYGAFYKCDKLSKLVIPFVGDGEEKKHLGYIFGHSSPTTENVNIPESLKEVVIKNSKSISIGDNAFYWCSNIEKISIIYPKDNRTINIGEYAFTRCSKLSEIVLPGSVKYIGKSAFAGCSSLNTIKFEGSKAAWRNSIIKGENWNLDVPATKVICSDGEVSL